MKKKLISIISLLIAMTMMFTGCNNSKSLNNTSNGVQEVTIICGYGEGGTADAVARKYAEVANSIQTDYVFSVKNVTGNDGFVAATTFANEAMDTKDLLVFGYGLCYRHDLGRKYDTEQVDFNRTAISPIGTIDDRTWIVYVKNGETLADVLEKSRNGGIRMSGGSPLSDCHLEFGSIISMEGGQVEVVTYDGGANQKQALLDGEVDVFVGTTQAAIEEVKSGVLMPVLAISDKEFKGFENANGPIMVSTVAGEFKSEDLSEKNDYSGCILRAGGTLAAHKGADATFIDDMTAIMQEVWKNDEFNSWIETAMLNKVELYGSTAQAYIDEACIKAILAYEKLR